MGSAVRSIAAIRDSCAAGTKTAVSVSGAGQAAVSALERRMSGSPPLSN